MELHAKITSKQAVICVIGLGYVGLPHASAFAQAGFRVLGLDVNPQRVAAVNRGHSDIPDVPSDLLAGLVGSGALQATGDYSRLAEADIVLICVPTPFDAMKTPDLAFIIAAAEGIAPHLHRGQMVILQSTTYPGTTEEIVQPILERGGLRAGHDFHLVFSPERIDPGNQQYSAHNTPKVVGGLTPTCTELACTLFSHLTPAVHAVSTPRAAEMTKLLENIFRSVNIALVNELAVLMERMNIDIWEVIAAARTKPFGFMAFTPGPGVGGHCIPVDPYYLSWKAREFDFYTKFIELAAEVNADMPEHVVRKIAAGLNLHGKALYGANVLVLGVAFKRDIDDARNSPAQRVIELLLDFGAKVEYHDPYVSSFTVGGSVLHRATVTLHSTPLAAGLAAADAVAIITGHTDLDYRQVVEGCPVVIDAVNVTRALADCNGRVIRLGAPLPTASAA
ncbi:MAG TPA: nucleotide sugar dehydrogenase [Anaerolineae bacterium]|nr:nucleotide sugar dehydrogenase [Anaerolineae bacterium]HNU04049.1 nucleotide sugar dehydrogenase [Anaerolineae bacterium]